MHKQHLQTEVITINFNVIVNVMVFVLAFNLIY